MFKKMKFNDVKITIKFKNITPYTFIDLSKCFEQDRNNSH